MGGGTSKKLNKEDMDFLLDNTNFTKEQIKQWYKGFIVSTSNIKQVVVVVAAAASAAAAGISTAAVGISRCCPFLVVFTFHLDNCLVYILYYAVPYSA